MHHVHLIRLNQLLNLISGIYLRNTKLLRQRLSRSRNTDGKDPNPQAKQGLHVHRPDEPTANDAGPYLVQCFHKNSGGSDPAARDQVNLQSICNGQECRCCFRQDEQDLQDRFRPFTLDRMCRPRRAPLWVPYIRLLPRFWEAPGARSPHFRIAMANGADQAAPIQPPRTTSQTIHHSKFTIHHLTAPNPVAGFRRDPV
jgi:hypothetical protein